MKSIPYALITAISFIWIGALIGINFIEAPSKFRSPGETIFLDIGVGNLKFYILNDLEIILFLIVLACNFFSTRKKVNLILILLIGFILAWQIGYLLPGLDEQLSLIQLESNLHESSLPIYYVVGEIIKVLLLLILGIRVIVSLSKHHKAADY